MASVVSAVTDGVASVLNPSENKSNHIVRITRKKKVEDEELQIIDKKAIKSIFERKDVIDCPVAIYSISGELRKGKSFFLNLLMHYMDFHDCAEEGAWRKDGNAQLNKGFEWRGGTERHTEGILIWKEPFWFSNSKYRKIAVFLMDTQGVFDDENSKRSDSIVFCLSTFLSSYQIYNLKDIISSANLEHLRVFSDYGKEVYGNDMVKSFQTLLFLMRDWQNMDFDFGFEEGQKYLHTVLNPTKKKSEEYKQLCSNIKKSFKDVKCVLLPYPGNKIARRKKEAPSAFIKDIDPEFLDVLDVVFRDMLDNIKVKEISGSPITGDDVINLAIKFSNKVKENNFGADALIEAVSSTVLAKLVQDCETMFHTKIQVLEKRYISNNEELDQLHKSIVTEVMDHFDKQNKTGLNPMVAKCRELLENSFDRRKLVVDNLNETSKCGTMEVYQMLVEDCYEAFVYVFEEKFRSLKATKQTISDEVIKKESESIMDKSLRLFKEVTGGDPLDSTIHEQYYSVLDKKMSLLQRLYCERNQMQQTCRVETSFITPIDNVEEFNTKISKLAEVGETVSDALKTVVEERLATQKEYKKMNLTSLKQKATKWKRIFLKKYNDEVAEMLDKKKISNENMEKHFHSSLSNFQKEIKSHFPKEIAEEASNQLKIAIEALFSEWKEINKFHRGIYMRELNTFDVFWLNLKTWLKRFKGVTEVEKMRLMSKPEKWSLATKMGDYSPKFQHLTSLK